MGLRGVVVVEDEEPGRDGARSPATGALEHVANRPILEHVLDELASAGVDEVLIVSSQGRAGEIRNVLAGLESRYSVPLRFVADEGPIDLAGGLRLSASVVGDGPSVVHLASGLLAEPLAPLVGRMRNGSPDVVLIVHQQPGADERLSPSTQRMLNIAELHPNDPALGMAGVWMFGRGALQRAADATWRSNGVVDLTNVAERVAAAGGGFHVRLVDGWRKYRGNPVDLLELNQIALDRLQVEARRNSNNGNRIEGRVLIHQQASVRASVIVGPTVIGPGARIADAYIGPYTSIGAGAHIEGAEIERSIIAAGASISHIGGRLAASVVGRDARVFRDFSLPRALRLRVGDGTEIALS